MKFFDLRKRVAFITGGNGGIGLGMAKGLAGAGATVVIAGRDKTKGQSALSELHSLGAQAEFVELDVLKEESCHAAVQHAVDRFGRLDVVVNNAGTSVRKQPQDLTAKDWHLVINTNLTSAFFCSKAAYPHMVKVGGGKIINIGSMMSVFASSYAAPYAASKRRDRTDGALDGGRLGEGQHPGQHDPAGMDRHRTHTQGARAGAGPA
jgi:2-deoxy-D-gluconate 3-dehydrogenase